MAERHYHCERCVNDTIVSISYDGGWPSLCCGELYVGIGDKTYEGRIISGGRVYFTNHYSESHIETGDWVVKMYDDIPKEYLSEVIDMVNETIPHGCCGGCV